MGQAAIMAMAGAGFAPVMGHRSGGSDPGPAPGTGSAGGRASPQGTFLNDRQGLHPVCMPEGLSVSAVLRSYV